METLELLKLWKNGDKAAREELILQNTGLVVSIARRFMDRGHDMEDLIQVGNIGLIKAIDNFNCNYEVKFSTYAVPVITGEIKRYIRDDGIIKISRSIKENGIKVRQAIEKISKDRCNEITVDEIAKECGLSREDVITSMNAQREVKSINEIVYNNSDNSVTLGDIISDTKDEHEKVIDSMLVRQLLSKLDDMQRQIIKLRYYDNKTQVEVAKIMNISQVKVSRLEKKILLFLKNCV